MNTAEERLRGILVHPEITIIEAIEVLNRAHKRIVLVVDDDHKLLGVVTDSNIRHAVLDNVDLNNSIAEIMRERPVTATDNLGPDQILRLMETTTCYQIPVIDSSNRVVDIRFLDEIGGISVDEKPIAVVMAGGLGTRLRPMTDSSPKSLLKVGGRPLLFTILDHLIQSGVGKIYLTLNYLGDAIREATRGEESLRSRVEFIEETKRLGTAGPISLIPERPFGPFVIINGDLLTKVAIDEMLHFHRHERNVLTVALKEQLYEVPFGVASIEGTRILGMIEKPKHTHFVNAGIYVAEPYVIDRIPKDTCFDMTTLISDLISNDLRVGSFPVHEYWLDVGEHDQLMKANADFKKYFKKHDR